MFIAGIPSISGTLKQLGDQQLTYGKAHLDDEGGMGQMPFDQLAAAWTSLGGAGGVQGLISEMNQQARPYHLTAADFGATEEALLPNWAKFKANNPGSSYASEDSGLNLPWFSPELQSLNKLLAPYANETGIMAGSARDREIGGMVRGYWDANGINPKASGSIGALAKSFLTEGAGPFIARAALAGGNFFPAVGADAIGLAQMAADAGLTGVEAANFVASGGALGSTSAGLIGSAMQVGENIDEFGNLIDMTAATPATAADVAAQTASAASTPFDALNEFVKNTFSPDNILKQGIKQGIKAGINALPDSGTGAVTSGGTSTGATPASSAGGTLSTTPSAGGDYLVGGVGIDPSGAALARTDGSDVFTQAGDLAIKGRGIINDAIQA